MCRHAAKYNPHAFADIAVASGFGANDLRRMQIDRAAHELDAGFWATAGTLTSAAVRFLFGHITLK